MTFRASDEVSELVDKKSKELGIPKSQYLSELVERGLKCG